MKLDRAIELNTESETSLRKHKFTDYADAVALGIEALKRILDNRTKLYPDTIQLLPGEDPILNSNRSLHYIKEVLESPLGRQRHPDPSPEASHG